MKIETLQKLKREFDNAMATWLGKGSSLLLKLIKIKHLMLKFLPGQGTESILMYYEHVTTQDEKH